MEPSHPNQESWQNMLEALREAERLTGEAAQCLATCGKAVYNEPRLAQRSSASRLETLAHILAAYQEILNATQEQMTRVRTALDSEDNDEEGGAFSRVPIIPIPPARSGGYEQSLPEEPRGKT